MKAKILNSISMITITNLTYNIMKHRVIEELERERKSQHLSIRKLAEMSGVMYTNINSIEKGFTSPSLNTAEKIANALGKKITLE